MIQFEKVNIEYLVAVIFLGFALVLGVWLGERELSGNIASGIVGYIGGRGVGYAISKAAAEKETPPKEKPEKPGEKKPAPKDAAEEIIS